MTSVKPVHSAAQQPPSRTLSRLALILVLGLAFALRVQQLGAQELRGDEAFSYFFVQQPVTGILEQTLTLGEPHPLGSYLLLKAWMPLAGETEFALRFPSLWFGVLAVALIWGLARALGLSPPVAGTSALLLAVNPHAVWHSQDARMYAMSLAFSLASTWAAWLLWTRPRARALLAYLGATGLALHTHYYTGLVVLAQNGMALLWGLVRSRKGSCPFPWKPWILAQAGLALLFGPWLWLAQGAVRGYQGNASSPGLGALWLRSLGALAGGEFLPETRTLLAGGAGLLFLLGVARLAREPRTRAQAGFLVALLAVPLLGMWAAAQGRPLFRERYVIVALPPLLLGVAQALEVRGRRALLSLLPLTALLLVQGAGVWRLQNDPAFSKNVGWRELARTLTTLSQGFPPEKVRLIQNYPDPTLWYYYQGPVDHLVLPPRALDGEGARAEVAKLVAEGVEWVLVPVQQAPGWDGPGLALEALCQAYAQVDAFPLGPWQLTVLARPEPGSARPVDARFVNGLLLRGVAVQPQEIVPGGILAVSPIWEAKGARLRGGEKLFLHLTSLKDDRPLAQVDRPLDFGPGPCGPPSYALRLPPDLPPGPYRLLFGLYDPEQPGAPRIPLLSGEDHVELGRFEGQ